MTKAIKYTLIILLSIAATTVYAQKQRPSMNVIDKDKYCGPTKWSCIDKHYGYYFISYAWPIPVSSNNIELEGKSGKLRVGYSYRYKIAKSFDIGAELNYARHNSRLIYDSIIAQNTAASKQKFDAIGHAIECGAFVRFNFGKSDFKHLGLHLDLGATYSYDFACVSKSTTIFNSESSHTKFKYKTRDKDAPYRHDYGIFLRFGYNNFAMICSYSFAKWDYNGHKRSPLLIGIQLNLYTR